MLLGKQSRHFVRHELEFKPPRGNGPALPFMSAGEIQDAASVLQKAIDANEAAYDVKAHDTVRITKLDVRPHDDMAILLIRRRDEEAATQVFEDGGTGELWKPSVTPKQAPALSAHAFMRLTPVPGAFPKYRIILEEVPGLGRTYIQYILRRILKAFPYEYMDAKDQVKSTYTIPTISGIPSETLGSALNGGSLKFVELVRPADLDGLDMAGLVPHPQRMRISVKADQNPLDLIGRIRAWAERHDWANLRVQVETSDDRTKVVEVARAVDAADVLFVRSEVVQTKEPIETCTDDINEELAVLARERLLSDENW